MRRRLPHRSSALRAALLAAAWLAACGGPEGDVPVPEPITPAAEPAGPVMSDDLPLRVLKVSVGPELNPEGLVEAEANSFQAGQPVYVSVRVQNARPEAAVRLVWIGPDGHELTEQQKPVNPGRDVVTFRGPDTGGWEAGAHRIEVWSGPHRFEAVSILLS